MKVWIELTGKSFLPEVPAMVSALSEAGHESVIIQPDHSASLSTGDILLRFGGLLRANKSRTYLEVHEFASSSTGSFPKLKNLIKRVVAGKPDARIFVDDWVKRELKFGDKIVSLTREQGAPPELLKCRTVGPRKFDVVYCGSITGRPGLVGAIGKLSDAGLTVGVAGSGSNSEVTQLNALNGVHYIGKISHEDVPKFIRCGNYGLNFCPDKYPFRFQVSTKVLEYLVAGLPIISNNYPWIRDHSSKLGYSFIDIDAISPSSGLSASQNAVISEEVARQLTFPEVFKRSGLIAFLESLIR